jgi:hypothetical protein
VHELLPIGPLRVRVQLADGLVGRSAHLLVADESAKLTTYGCWAELEVRTVLDHEVVVIS